jgi:amino acid adenylation domain-containing protein
MMMTRIDRLALLSPAKRAELRRLRTARIGRPDGMASGSAEVCQTRRTAPASFAQERQWFLAQLQPDDPSYNLPVGFELRGELDCAALERSLCELVRRHEPLRTTYSLQAGELVQVIEPPAPVVMPTYDLRELPHDSALRRARELIESEAWRPFNFQRDRPFRAQLVRLADDIHQLLVVTHHIAADGSLGTLVRELGRLYRAHSEGRPSPLPEVQCRYADLAARQRQRVQGTTLKALLDFWTDQLADPPPPLQLPTERVRPAAVSTRGSRYVFELPADLVRAARVLSRAEGTTLFTTFLAAFQSLLFRYTGQPDVLIATPVIDRWDANVESVVGCLVNTLVLRVRVSGELTFRELVAQVRERVLGAFAHRDLPFDKLVQAVRPDRNTGSAPLAQVMFSLLESPVSAGLEDLDASMIQLSGQHARFDVLFSLWSDATVMRGAIEYRADLFDESSIARMARHFQTLLHGLIADPDRPVGSVPLLTEVERRQREAWNATAASLPGGLLHTPFEESARTYPDRLAIASTGRRLTYAELDQRSRQLATRLRSAGVRPSTLVAIVMDKGWEQVVAALAIVRAGAAYLPLSPGLPRERLWHLLHQGQVELALTQPSHDLSLSWPDGLVRWRVEADAIHPSQVDCGVAPDGTPAPNDLAYVIFTSGSTGQPKGVMIEHAAALNTILDINQRFGVGPDDRVLAVSSLSFDLSVYDIFGTLAAGGTIVFPDSEKADDPAHWVELIEAEQVTVWNSVPALLQMLLDYGASRPDLMPHSLRLAMLSGDWIPLPQFGQLERLSAGTRMVSLGGATEASIWSIAYPIDSVDPNWRSIPYGRPLANQRMFVLDDELEACAVGVIGQLFIGGVGLARGYWRDADRTHASFITHPRTGERLYRTGDLGRYLSDGTIEFLGRQDHQVKIRGFRVELGEIETALASHPAVKEVVVLALGDVTRAEPKARALTRLVAFVVQPGASGPSPEELRAFVKTRLPDYMVPSQVVAVDTLPLTRNGKVDRSALATMSTGAHIERDGQRTGPRDALELRLVHIWEDVLGISSIGVADDFFALGGHSLLAVRVVARVERELCQSLPLSGFFQYPTIEQQAAMLRRAQPHRWSALVSFRSDEPLADRRPPLFCVHPVGGTVFCYQDLARGLGTGQMYALQARGLETGQVPNPRIQDMAAEYLDAILEVQPRGPFHLAGWSMGGVVALEMARALHERGHRIGLVAMLDSELPTNNADPRGGVDRAQVLRMFVCDLAASLGREAPPIPDGLSDLEPEHQLSAVLESIRTSELLPPDLDAAQLRRLVGVFLANLAALSTYAPPAPFPGRFVIFRPESTILETSPDTWAQRGFDVEVRRVQGSHYSMLQPPLGASLGRALRSLLREPGR